MVELRNIESLVAKIKEVVFSGCSATELYVPPSAYDTAWVALVPDTDRPQCPMFPQCLNWILGNQDDGGFWGEPEAGSGRPTLGCVTSTVACIFALRTWQLGADNIQRGLRFLSEHADEILSIYEGEDRVPRWFAIIFPGLLELASSKGLGIYSSFTHPELWQTLFDAREKILQMTEHSIEDVELYVEALPETYVGRYSISENRSEDGSLFQSPASTAFAFMRTGDKDCLNYLLGMIHTCKNGVPGLYPVDRDLIKLCLVDQLQQLGIAHYFSMDIDNFLHHIYNIWVQEESKISNKYGEIFQIYKDSLAFRLLRMHGYHISPERFCLRMLDHNVLQKMEKNCSNFIGAIYSVHKAAQVTFRQDKELENVKVIVAKILRRELSAARSYGKLAPSLAPMLIADELQLPWLARADDLEHLKHIERHGVYDLWIGKMHSYRIAFDKNILLLELARKDFTYRRSIYRTELEELKSWSRDRGFSNIGFGREKLAICYYAVATLSCLHFTSDVRKYLTKSSVIVTIVDDFFDERGSLDELYVFTKAIKSWEGQSLSGHSKILFDAIDNLVDELASAILKQHGYDIKRFLRDNWCETVESWLQEAKWSHLKHAPIMHEYLEVGMISVGVKAMFLPVCYLASGELLNQCKRKDRSRILELLMTTARLLNDIHTFEKEKEHGKSNMAELYMRENPSANIEESIAYINDILARNKMELLEYLLNKNQNDMPKEHKDLFLLCLKVFHMFYNSSNLFDSPTALVKSINKIFIDPLPEIPTAAYSYDKKKDHAEERTLVMKSSNNRSGKKKNFEREERSTSTLVEKHMVPSN